MTVRAYDSAYPEDFVEKPIVIEVSRNEFYPRFIDTPFRNKIDEQTIPGKMVLDVNATDKNVNVRYQVGTHFGVECSSVEAIIRELSFLIGGVKIYRSGQVRSECLKCTFRASCCSVYLSRAQVHTIS